MCNAVCGLSHQMIHIICVSSVQKWRGYAHCDTMVVLQVYQADLLKDSDHAGMGRRVWTVVEGGHRRHCDLSLSSLPVLGQR